MSITQSPAWLALENHHQQIRGRHLRDLFERDPERSTRMSVDYSKNIATAETLTLLLDLARTAEVESWREKMFAGVPINHTEHRAVLHTALRNMSSAPVLVHGIDVMPQVHAVLRRMRHIVESATDGSWRGATGERITDVVNIGIGGSHLGPQMATESLRAYHQTGLRVHHCANVDPADLGLTLRMLNPASTVFVIVSKTFTTQETLANAGQARAWLQNGLPDAADVAPHFVAVSSNVSAARSFGIAAENVLDMWDWVGGRYSLWSSVGISVALATGMDAFIEMLTGGWQMDMHFRSAPLGSNMPVILALLGIWYSNFFAAESHCVVPYEESLRQLPAHLQQLDMESNGKRVQRDGSALDCASGPLIWGSTGTNAQHAYFQLLHQGGRLVPIDFLIGMQSVAPHSNQHTMLVANCLAQAEALMRGRTLEETRAEMQDAGIDGRMIDEIAPHRVFPGNAPSNMIVYPKLTPRILGQLVALYEQKVFVQGTIWGLNSFDQWGVELGKQLAGNILRELDGTATCEHDSSTTALIARYRRQDTL
jgi:glucose-6-phosphate isomerase